MVHQLLYVSAANQNMTPSEIDKILETSVQHNGPANITGVLLSVDNTFFQLLEGDEHRLHDTFSRIEGDHRHHRVTWIASRKAPYRACPKWSMAYKQVSDSFENAPLLAIARAFAEHGQRAMNDEYADILLRHFIRMSMAERALA